MNSQIIFFTNIRYKKYLGTFQINKSAGPDDMLARLLKVLRYRVTQPLNKNFHQSINLYKVAQDWKAENLTPIFKEGFKYTYVSLTSVRETNRRKRKQ